LVTKAIIMKCFFLLAPALLCTALHIEANPVGQVLKLLQRLYDTIVADGKKEQKQFESFSAWCEDASRERRGDIETGSAQVEDLNAGIDKATANISVLQSRYEEISSVVAANTGDLKAARNIRDKEQATFKKEEDELVDTVATLRRAQQVLQRHYFPKGRSRSFAQAPQAFQELTNSLGVIMDASLFSIEDTKKLKAFLQSEEEDGAPNVKAPPDEGAETHGGSIMDILADMQEKAEGMLAEARKTEVNARHNYELLAQSLTDALKVQNEDLSATKLQLGRSKEARGNAQGALATTSKGLVEDKNYLRELTANCQQRAQDYEISQKSRAEEVKALAEAKQIIEEATGDAQKRAYNKQKEQNNSFFQVGARNPEIFDQVEARIKKLGKKDGNFLLTQLAGQIRAAVTMSVDPLEKVKKLIREMITRLTMESQEEASHKAFCDKETATNEVKRIKLQAQADKLATQVEKAQSDVATLKGEISLLQSAISNIALSQRELDALRLAEHEEFMKAKSDFQQGLDGIRSALRILREYYAKQGEQKDAELIQEPASGGRVDSASGIIGILDVAEQDFARSLAESQAAEDDAQEVYTKTTQENKVVASTKQQGVEEKTQEVQRLEQQIGNATSDNDGVHEELSAVLEYLEKLRPQCTVKVDSYEVRKERRESEIEGLKESLNILENEVFLAQLNSASGPFLAAKTKSHIAIQ